MVSVIVAILIIILLNICRSVVYNTDIRGNWIITDISTGNNVNTLMDEFNPDDYINGTCKIYDNDVQVSIIGSVYTGTWDQVNEDGARYYNITLKIGDYNCSGNALVFPRLSKPVTIGSMKKKMNIELYVNDVMFNVILTEQ